MRAAFYKGTRPGLAGHYNRLVRWWEPGPFSHVELIFSDGMATSSSFADGGVRFKQIEFSPSKWDFIQLPVALESAARAWFEAHKGEKYDLRGKVRFALDFMSEEKGKWFCSEALAASLGMQEPWRFGPNNLFHVLAWGFERDTIGITATA